MTHILLIVLILVSILLFTTIGIDLYLYFRGVFGRYKIGRWNNESDWIKSVRNINLKWLKNTPTVKITDNERYVIKDLLKGNYRNSTIQSWQEAGSLFGAIDTDGSESQIDDFISSKIDANTGKWVNVPKYVDGAILGYALTKTSKNTDEIKPALDEIIELIERNKGKDGTIFYRDFIADIRFVDTIGFICPFLTWYGQKFHKPAYIDLAILQIKSYVEKAFLKEKMIPAHAYDLKKEVPLGVYGWGRGLGWFILGVVDMYNELDKTHPEKEYLKEIIIETAKDLLPFQKSNGSFNAMLAVDTSRHDSSITSLGGWLFFNTYQITREKKYLEAAKKCVISLMQVTRRDGTIDFCQGDTKGIGDYAKTFEAMPFVQGLTIRFVTSLNKVI